MGRYDDLLRRHEQLQEAYASLMEDRESLAAEVGGLHRLEEMRAQGKALYPSDAKLGVEYKHKRFPIQGFATSVTFFENACERVILEWDGDNNLTGKRLHTESFDIVDLVEVETGKQATAEQTGGPSRGEELLYRPTVTTVEIPSRRS